MKKHFTLKITEPCSQDFSKMTKNEIGSHCQLCNKNVLDFTGKTNREIAEIISKHKNKQNICARVQPQQLQQDYQYNTHANFINLKNAVVLASTVLSSVAAFSQEKTEVVSETPKQTEMQHVVMGKIAMPVKSEIITLKVIGNLVNQESKKCITKNDFPELNLYYGNSKVQLNPISGKFEIDLKTASDTKFIIFRIENEGNFQELKIPITKQDLNSKKIIKTLNVDTETMFKSYMLGGLGINFTDNKSESKRV
jgi:hypothetical protein